MVISISQPPPARLTHLYYGIGRVRRQWMANEVGQVGIELLKNLKKILDPDNILNLGVLIPDEKADFWLLSYS